VVYSTTAQNPTGPTGLPSIKRIEEDPFIPEKSSVRGFVYEVGNGRLREVK